MEGKQREQETRKATGDKTTSFPYKLLLNHLSSLLSPLLISSGSAHPKTVEIGRFLPPGTRLQNAAACLLPAGGRWPRCTALGQAQLSPQHSAGSCRFLRTEQTVLLPLRLPHVFQREVRGQTFLRPPGCEQETVLIVSGGAAQLKTS